MNNKEPIFVCSVQNKHTLPQAIIAELKKNDQGIEVEEIKSEVNVFKNLELMPEILDSVRGKEVTLIATQEENINIEMIKVILYIDALRRASAGKITLWMPYFYYERQDKTGEKRVPISARVFADVFQDLGINHFITVHLHNEAIEGFFKCPTDKLGTKKIFWNAVKDFCTKRDGSFDESEWTIVFPDEGAAKGTRDFQLKVHAAGRAGFSKIRVSANEVESMDFFGHVKGERCLIVDDMADTGGTMVKAAENLIAQGAKEVFAVGTHALLNGNAVENLQNSPIVKIFVSDSMNIPKEKMFPKLEIVSLAPMLAGCIIKDHTGGSLRQENW